MPVLTVPTDGKTTTITRARCDGWEGYRKGRKHLIDLDRLVNVTEGGSTRQGVWVKAVGPCPVCGMGWNTRGTNSHGPADRSGTYTLVGVKGTFLANKPCNAACRQSASPECTCHCGGAEHGMNA